MDELLQEMTNPAASAVDPARRRRLFATVAILILAVVGVTSLTTQALFTDNEAVGTTEFSSGTVDVTAPATITFDIPTSGMAPGDTVTAPLLVENQGSLAMRYAIRYTGVNADPEVPLTSQLSLQVYAQTQCSAGAVADATPIAGVPAPLARSGVRALVGDSAVGLQSGDRQLNSGKSENLCFALTFDKDASNRFQDASGSLNLRIDAEQVTNNP